MRKFKYYLVILTLSSCTHGNSNKEYDIILKSVLDRTFSTFCLLEYSHKEIKNLSDANSLIFITSGTESNSYIFVVKRQDDQIVRCVYHKVEPYNLFYNFNAGDKVDKTFFVGFSFELDQNKWEEIKGRTKILLANTATSDFSRTLGGQDYVLSHNSETVMVNSGDVKKKYSEFSRYLEDEVIRPIESLRIQP